jgi:hypothetical protein
MKKTICIVLYGKSEYHIATSEFADATELFAASELQKYIYECTDTLVPYFSDRCELRGKEIRIGFSARVPMDKDATLGDEGYLIRVSEDEIRIAGNTPRGTLYGVYAFCEKFLGLRKFTKDVEKIAHTDALTLAPCVIREKPFFEYREAYFRDAWDADFSAKNKLNANLAPIPIERGGHFKFFNCHHSFFDLVPPKYYKEAHPEYYSVREDEGAGRQLCLSNPDVIAIAKKQLRTWIKENPTCKVFSIAQNDGGGYCECARCKAIDTAEGSPAGSIITFANALAEDIEKDYPDVLLHTFAYQYSQAAPGHLRPHRNVIVRIANIDCPVGCYFDTQAQRNDGTPETVHCKEFMDCLSAWTRLSDRVYIWGYAVNFLNYLQPFLPLRQFAAQIRLYAKYGVKGVLMQGNFSYGGDASMGDLKSYLFARLLWNPDADENAIAEEFIDGVFGKGAPFIKEYVHLMADAVQDAPIRIYDGADAAYYSDALIAHCDALFLKAEAAAESDAVRRRIEREHLAIEYLKVARIENDAERAAATERFAARLKSHRITEIHERTELSLSLSWMKNSRYAKERPGAYSLYYIVK